MFIYTIGYQALLKLTPEMTNIYNVDLKVSDRQRCEDPHETLDV